MDEQGIDVVGGLGQDQVVGRGVIKGSHLSTTHMLQTLCLFLRPLLIIPHAHEALLIILEDPSPYGESSIEK